MKYITPILASLFVLFSTSEIKFTNGADMPTGRQEIQPGLLGNKIVVVGGFSGPFIVSNKAEAYNIKKDTWETLPDYPKLFHHIATASHKGIFYTFGGFSGGNFSEWTPNPDSYAFKNGAWEEIATMPTKRGEQLAATYKGNIYVIGGTGEGKLLTVNEMYDPKINSWTTKAPMPTQRTSTGIAVIKDKIYVVGGRQFTQNGMKNMATLEAYSPKEDKWYSLPDMPEGSGGIIATSLNGKLYAIGGEVLSRDRMAALSFIYEFDPKANKWTKLKDMPQPRHGSGGISYKGKIYVVGGADKPAFGVTSKTLIIEPK